MYRKKLKKKIEVLCFFSLCFIIGIKACLNSSLLGVAYMLDQELVISIEFIDRLGLGYEIFEKLNRNEVNLLATEAEANQGMMIKFKQIDENRLNNLIKDLSSINGVISVSFIEQMPYEQREDQLKTILNLISEGIVAINKQGLISHINETACKVLHITEQEAIGYKIKDVLNANIPILETLSSGKSYSLKEIKIKKNNKLSHYLTSGSPIINEKGQIMGAVATIKDYRQVEEIISKVDYRKKLTTFNDIVFESNRMRVIIETAKTVSKGDSSILLRGESGTGKELFARAIHMESNRVNRPFIAINCAALPETLLESELFGYEEGAFTGASKGGKKGLFEQADSGTLFLDEIGEISPHIQVRLLRVLQENVIRRVGGNKEINVSVRIIAATHRDLEAMIAAGDFREDLYYRLNVIPIRIPPLRERPEDIPLIAQHLIRKISSKLNKHDLRLSKETFEYLMNQKWPGNVRQLENTLERIINVIDEMESEITLYHFYKWGNLEVKKRGNQDSEDMLHISIPIEDKWPTLKHIVGKVEKQVLQKVLLEHASSRKAGRILGVSNTTILNKMKNYGIDNKK